MRRIVVGGLLSLALLTSSCKSDPSLPETWEKRLTGAKNMKEKLKIVDDLRGSKFMGPAMVPMLEKQLAEQKKGDVKAAIVRVLGEAKQASSVAALSDAMDPAATDSDMKTMNKEIANALGKIGDKSGVPALTSTRRQR